MLKEQWQHMTDKVHPTQLEELMMENASSVTLRITSKRIAMFPANIARNVAKSTPDATKQTVIPTSQRPI